MVLADFILKHVFSGTYDRLSSAANEVYVEQLDEVYILGYMDALKDLEASIGVMQDKLAQIEGNDEELTLHKVLDVVGVLKNNLE